jgi:hypothetical protein
VPGVAKARQRPTRRRIHDAIGDLLDQRLPDVDYRLEILVIAIALGVVMLGRFLARLLPRWRFALAFSMTREKAALADHLWREGESGIGPTASQLSRLNARAVKALRNPASLKPAGDALRRLRR